MLLINLVQFQKKQTQCIKRRHQVSLCQTNQVSRSKNHNVQESNKESNSKC